MGDLLFVVIVVAFFTITLAYVKGCELIVGPDTHVLDETPGQRPHGHPTATGVGAWGDGAATAVAAADETTVRPGEGTR